MWQFSNICPFLHFRTLGLEFATMHNGEKDGQNCHISEEVAHVKWQMKKNIDDLYKKEVMNFACNTYDKFHTSTIICAIPHVKYFVVVRSTWSYTVVNVIIKTASNEVAWFKPVIKVNLFISYNLIKIDSA